MMNKLAFRNVRRSAKDYLIYFMTMAVVTALMFSFNTLLFSEDVQNLFQVAGVMAAMVGIATFFVVLIVAWLINYMVRFILQKRSREFSIYLLVGMKKREIARLYIRENLLLGAGAFGAGMGLGALLQQILLSVFYSMVQMDYHLRLEFNSYCVLMTAACYGGCYLLALFRCRRRFRKMNIHDLMASEKRNEEIRESHEKTRRMLLPLSILFLLIFGIFLFCWKDWNTGVLLFFLTGLVLSIYLFYMGISAWIFCYVKDKKSGVYRGDVLFLLRQFSSKVKTMSFTMGTLTALFTLALLGSSVAFMFNHFQNQMLNSKFPFDVQLYSEQADDDFQREIQLLKKETKVKELYTYSIYENGTRQVNAWLYSHLKALGGDYHKADGTPDWEGIEQTVDSVYCEYDTYMKLSDYNRLRQMLGLSKIELEENQYAIHLKERVLKETGDFSKSLNIKGNGRALSFAGYHTESFSQDGHNGGDYVIVVPDAAAEAMRPYYAELAADIKGEAPQGLQDRLDSLDPDEDEDEEGEDLGNFCCGSDSILVFSADNLVRDNLILESKYMLCSIIFPLFYVGLVFLCVALTVLSVQQLSDSAKYGFRYRVLSRMGCSRQKISRMILKQLLGYYMCPALMALTISGIISVYTGGRFNFYTGVSAPGAVYFLLSAALFFGIYAAYFILTYVGFKRNVFSTLQ
ncbi:MAG: FtsX-like permease family protein [Firmicutes bacterium]|nr:FtsX-like permease family protein [Bacillota bacterium]